MTPVKQTILHDPENGVFGNCAQAAFASIFELPLGDVPHFADGADNTKEGGLIYEKALLDWLSTMGYSSISLQIVPEYLELWCDHIAKRTEYHLISGMSPRFPDSRHLVVAKNGEIIHDPHPDNTGLLPPTDDEPWYFEIIVKRF